jgi:hypothetical protein
VECLIDEWYIHDGLDSSFFLLILLVGFVHVLITRVRSHEAPSFFLLPNLFVLSILRHELA